MCHWKVVGRVEARYDVLPDGDPWGLLQSPNCKKRVTTSDHFLGDIRLLRNHAFSVASFDT
jgi:hypothetical protein